MKIPRFTEEIILAIVLLACVPAYLRERSQPQRWHIVTHLGGKVVQDYWTTNNPFRPSVAMDDYSYAVLTNQLLDRREAKTNKDGTAAHTFWRCFSTSPVLQ